MTSLPAEIRPLSVHVNAMVLTLDAFWDHRGLGFAEALTEPFREDLRTWHQAIGHHTGRRAPEMAESLSSLQRYLGPETAPLYGTCLNWLARGSDHQDTSALMLWMEALTRFHRSGALPVVGLSDPAADRLLAHFGEIYLPLTQAAAAFVKEWSPYATGGQYDYNLRHKTKWDAALYAQTHASELDFDLGAALQTLVENHAARYMVDWVQAHLSPEDCAALDTRLIETLEKGGLYADRPRRLDSYRKHLRPLASHQLAETRIIPPPTV